MRARALILLMHTLTLAVPFTAGGAEECDPHLLVRITNPYGYRLRGDRCEGLYVEEVGGAPLLIASWTESFLDYGLHSKQPLEIEWEAPHGTGDIRLRAQGLRRRLYYRMDTVRPFGSTSFAWPSDLLAGIGIPKRDVGVVGVTQVPVSATQREVYLPLRISQGGKVAAQPISYRLVLLPGVELSEVFITMVSAADNGGTILKDAEAVGYGYYPAERPVEIAVSNIPAPGFYHLEVGATIKSGGSATAEFWFYHSGN